MKTLVLIPTYNEKENIPILVGELMRMPGVHVMVLDDQSPDGTGRIADQLAQTYPGRVQCLHRTGQRGLGVSYLEGFHRAIDSDFDFVGQMDADLSHDPKYLPAMIEAASNGADLVIGSRWIPGGSIVNWPKSREALSRGGNLYVRLLLGIDVHDATAGFRLFRRATLEKIDIDSVQSTGYVFQTDMAYRTLRAGLKVAEVPIEFIERERGDSKMSRDVAVESLKSITRWGLRERARQVRRGLRRKGPRRS